MTRRLGGIKRTSLGVLASLSLAATLACGAAMTGCGGDDNNQPPTGDDGGGETSTTPDAGKDATTPPVDSGPGVDAKVDTGTSPPDTGTPTPEAGPDSPTLSACATPTFTPVPGTVAQGTAVTLAAASLPTTNGFIYYTVDGTIPTHNSPAYSTPIVVNASQTIRALAFASGSCTDSNVATGVYTVPVVIPDAGPPDVVTLPQCGVPTFAPTGGAVSAGVTVTITPPAGFPAAGLVFYTVDGTLPTHASLLYSGPIQVTSTESLHAIAYASGVCSDSTLATASFTVTVPPQDGGGPPAVPTFDLTSATLSNDNSVALSSDANATICYRTDGNAASCTNGTCDSTSTRYTGARVAIGGSITNASGVATLSAVACRAGTTSSAVATQTYTFKVAPPITASPAPGTLPFLVAGYSPTISDPTGGSTINVALGTSMPTCTVGTAAANPSVLATINANTTVNAIACKTGYLPSDVAPLVYTLKLNDPALDDNSVPFFAAFNPAITDGANGANDWFCTSATATVPACGTTLNTCTTGTQQNHGAATTTATVATTGTTVRIVACGVGLASSNVVSSTYTLQLDPPFLEQPGTDPDTGLPVTSYSIPVAGLPGGLVTINQDTNLTLTTDQDYGFVCVMNHGTPACGTNACAAGTIVNGVTHAVAQTLVTTPGGGPVAGDAYSIIGCPSATGASSGFLPSDVTTVSYGAPGSAGAPSITPTSAGPYNATITPLISNSDVIAVTTCYTVDGTTPICTPGVCTDGTLASLTGGHVGTVSGITVTNGGAGYIGVPIVTLSGGAATTQATAHAVLTGGVVTSIVVDTVGSGYSVAPTVTFTGGAPTTAAAATAVVDNSIFIAAQGTDNEMVKAISCNATETSSTVSTETYNFTMAVPDFSFVQTTIVNGDLNGGGAIGGGQMIRLSTASNFAGESIHYVTGGVAATCSTGTVITGPAVGNVTVPTTSPFIISAIACGTAQQPSVARAATFTVSTATPVLTAGVTNSPTGNVTWENTFSTTIATATGAGTRICYTTDGTTPTCTAGTCGGGSTIPAVSPVVLPITTSGTQLRAVACTATLASSGLASANYTLNMSNVIVNASAACPSAATLGLDQTVVSTALGGPTHNMTICYTTDGTTPAANCAGGTTGTTTCFTTGGAGALTSDPLDLTSSAALHIVACDTGFGQPAVIPTSASVTPYANTVTVDGAISMLEWPAGDRLAGAGAVVGLLSHDATNLFLGATGYTAAAGTDTVFYIGDGTGGSTTPPPVFGATAIPFPAKWAFGWATDDSAPGAVTAFTFNGTAWTSTTLAGLTVGFQSASTVEFGLPLADVGTPATLMSTGAIVSGVGTTPTVVTQWPLTGAVSDVLTSCLTPLAEVAPVLASLAPTSGTAAGGTVVTLTGYGFTGVTAVNFGATAGITPVAVTNTSITVTSPVHAIGAVPVTVVTPVGTSNAVTYTFN